MNSPKYLLFLSLIQTISLFLSGCGAVSIDDRYAKRTYESQKSEKSGNIFDFSPYSTIPSFCVSKPKLQQNAGTYWYSYTERANDNEKATVKAQGYRVQVLSTDNFDEADNLKLDIYSKLHITPVYVLFESPYYKVKVGDLQESNLAYDLSFKLKQLGYKNTRIVQDSILIKK